MKAFIAVLALVVALGSAGVAVYVLLEQDRNMADLKREIAQLEAHAGADRQLISDLQVAQAREAKAPESLKAVEKDLAGLREKVESASARVDVLGTQVSALRESDKNDKVEMAKMQKRLSGAPAGVSGDALRKEDLEKLIDKKLRESGPLQGQGPPRFEALADRLELDETQRKELEDILRGKKTEHLNILKTPRADGSNLLDEFGDELVEAIRNGKPNDDTARPVFMNFHRRMMTEKVPGTDTTYAQTMMKAQQETRVAFKEALPQDKFQAMLKLGIHNPLDMRIPEEPLESYIQGRLRAAGVAPPPGDGPPPPDDRQH